MLDDFDDGLCLFLNNNNTGGASRRNDFMMNNMHHNDNLHLAMLDQEALLKQRQAILNIIDRLILNGSVLFERSQPNSNQVDDDETFSSSDKESCLYNQLYQGGPPASGYGDEEEKKKKKKESLKKKKLVNTVNCNNFKQALHQRNIVACCVDTIMKINDLMDKGLIEIEKLKNDLVNSERGEGESSLYADFEYGLEYVEPQEVKLSIDETDNWISRYVFYRYAKTFNVEESCYTMSRSQFDKFLTHLREVMGERGLGQDILIIKDVLDEGDEHLDNPFEDDSIAASLASSNQIVLDVGSVLTDLRENRTISEGTFLNWFQSVLVLYIMFKYNQ